MRKILTLLCSLSSCVALAQYEIPSPDALGLSKYANTPVNYYTGTPGISVPLGQLSGRELSVPFGLSYNASGHKVQEMAGSVGLGWSLSAGGTITRIVRGLPDEVNNGFCGTANVGELATVNHPTGIGDTYLGLVNNGTYDGEPDLFYYNFMGMTGKFIVDASGQGFTIPYQALSIKTGICRGVTQEFEIIDQNGIVYKFGSNEDSREVTTSWPYYYTSAKKSYISSWHLSQVSSPNGTDEINFTYGKQTRIKYPIYSYVQYNVTPLPPGCGSDVNVEKPNHTMIEVVSKFPTTITSSLGTATLDWSNTPRLDYLTGGTYLRSIKVTNVSGTTIHKHRFEYSYFQADETCNCGEEALCRRLKLDKIFDRGTDAIVSFTYNTSTNLPRRNSPNYDHWGFYNNNSSSSHIPASTYNATPNTNDHNFPTGASRAPHADRSKANILTRMDFRGGAYQEFSYEGHTVLGVSGNMLVGGVRIAGITSNSDEGPSITKAFTYLSRNGNPSGRVYSLPPAYAIRVRQTPSSVFKRFSQSPTNLFDINGAHVGYARVTETVTGNGKTVYTFTNLTSNADGTKLIDPVSQGYVPQSSKAWERGLLRTIEVWDNSGNLLSRELNEYILNRPDKRKIKAWITDDRRYQCDAPGTNIYAHGSYDIISRPIVHSVRKSYTFQPGDTSKIMLNLESYGYDDVTNQVTGVTVSNANPSSGGGSLTTLVKYVTHPDYYYSQTSGVDCESQRQICQANCDDIGDATTQNTCYAGCASDYNACIIAASVVPQSSAIIKLKNRHQINAPVEILQLYKDNLIKSTINIYSDNGDKVNLKEVHEWNKPVASTSYTSTEVLSDGTFQKPGLPLRKVKTYNSYNATTGNLTQETDFNGRVTNYSYDANGLLSGSTSLIPTNGDNTRTVSNTNIPLIGNASGVDVNGVTTNYEYDGYGRLKFVRRGADIVNSTRYNYKNESVGFTLSPDVTWVTRNVATTFSVTDIVAPFGNTPQFAWDFGDETVVDGGTSINHTYTTVGTYTLKLVGMNSEFGARTITKTIKVGLPLNAYIQTEGGPTSVNLCTDPNPAMVTIRAKIDDTGCNEYITYKWSYIDVGQTEFQDLDNSCNSINAWPPNVEGSSYYQCVITDACGNTRTIGRELISTRIDNCNGGGGGQNQN